MIANGRPFSIINAQMFLEVPFFQRSYVWGEDNWGDLLENLESSEGHFLGSILLKEKPVASGEIQTKLVIDGQQRLTTLSILVRALYDTIVETTDDMKQRFTLENIMTQLLFTSRGYDDKDPEVKIRSSYLDREPYTKVIKGAYAENWKSITEDDGKIPQCYQFFRNHLEEQDGETVKGLWNLLSTYNLDDEKLRTIVIIDLKSDENEQLIFDTLNTAGIRLSCSDIVKNELFRTLKLASDFESRNIDISEEYEKRWREVFMKDDETDAFWRGTRQTGRLSRDNLEILLHSVAVINGFFDPEKDKLPQLAQKYRDYFKAMSADLILDFLDELKNYAALFKTHFGIDKGKHYSYNDGLSLLLLILEVQGITSMYPYILRELKNDPDGCEETFRNIASYLMWHAVCGIPTKNYNKECNTIMGGKSLRKLFSEKCETYGADLMAGLRNMPPRKNHIASLILFTIELKRRQAVEGKVENSTLQYTLTLEHIMPRMWRENWGIGTLPAYCDGEICQDPDVATAVREKAVFEIGNMTLLKSRLNTSLSNACFDEKIEGNGTSPGMKISDLKITAQDVIEFHAKADRYGGVWDERIIADRTEALAKEFLEIWPDLRK